MQWNIALARHYLLSTHDLETGNRPNVGLTIERIEEHIVSTKSTS
jgi:hypothetical protein